MKRTCLLLSVLVAFILCSGCAYKASVPVVTSANVYTAYEDKIPGTVALIVDANSQQLDKTVKPSTYAGSAHNYPISLSSSFTSSVRNVTESLFSSVIERKDIPTSSEMADGSIDGCVLIRIKHYEPRLSFIQGFFSSTASSSVDLSFDFTIRDRNNNILMSSAVSASRTAEGDSGGAGGGGATVIADATSKALQEALERYAERVANSNKVREGFSAIKKEEPVLKPAKKR